MLKLLRYTDKMYSKRGGFTLLAVLALAAILRFSWLTQYPPALFVDEAAIGYNAWSLSHDLRDEYGTFLPLAFRSWGTYTAPLQFYLAVPGVLMFGLNEFGTRFHAALLGLLTVFVVYLLVCEWFGKRTLALTAAGLLAISPWHIHQSRMAVEPIISTFFFCLGVYFLLRFRRTYRTLPLALSAVCFVLTAYAYHSARLTSPLFLLLFAALHAKILVKQYKKVLMSIGCALVVAAPLLWYMVTQHEQALARPRAISIFTNGGVGLQLWEWTTTDGAESPHTLTRAFHNKVMLYMEDFTRRYMSHFDPSFLFVTGDPHERFQIPNTGILLLTGILLVPVGIAHLFRRRYHKRDSGLLLGWILIAPIVSSFAIITPNSYHMLEAVPAWAVLAAMGTQRTLSFLKTVIPPAAPLFIAGLLTANVLHYLGSYYTIIPYQLAHFWGYGFKEGVLAVREYKDQYDTIIAANRHYIYFLYYFQYDPLTFRREYIRAPGVDEMGFENIIAFGKFQFPKTFDWKNLPKRPGILYIAPRDEIPDYWTDEPQNSGIARRNKVRIFKRVYFPNGEVAMKVADVLP